VEHRWARRTDGEDPEVGTGWMEGVHPDDVQGRFDGFLTAFQV